ncbi:beta-1,6-N-acetylglucosaminyltransferase [Butyrivibrio sp. MC2021]|uniref:beta-1,6-N-acetylglucosaminyltransferase n=1 Tax=Butyrivibrio sp. MC2021 TaxID=1408306 RepID=UPI000685C1CB|nr:beta-1,6-N-acetylglucosaminyltransferase [Butyrivibrio sp. MC2021]
MRHAFLIIAHNNWWQLKQLIKLLDSESHDLYIHIDKRSKNYDEQQFCNIALKSRVKIFQEYKVYWGGFSQVEVELFLLGKASEFNYDYYHIISGGDLPLKSNYEIDAFFENNRGYEFIDYDESKLNNDPEISRRTRIYHFLQNYRRISSFSFVNSIFIFCERCLLLLQMIFGVNRTRRLDWTIKYGSNWVSITDGMAKEVLKQKEKIGKVFKWTNCADELFIQTVAFNSIYKDNIYDNGLTDVMNNMRLVDWERGSNGSPYTYRNDDYEYLIKSNALFARKFSEGVDKDIIERIIDYLNGEKNESCM